MRGGGRNCGAEDKCVTSLRFPWRVPKQNFFFLSLLSPGVNYLAGHFWFPHRNKKKASCHFRNLIVLKKKEIRENSRTNTKLFSPNKSEFYRGNWRESEKSSGQLSATAGNPSPIEKRRGDEKVFLFRGKLIQDERERETEIRGLFLLKYCRYIDWSPPSLSPANLVFFALQSRYNSFQDLLFSQKNIYSDRHLRNV